MVSSGLNERIDGRFQRLNGVQSVRRVLRFGQKISGADTPSVPARYRGLDGPLGQLEGVRLRAASAEVWLRLGLRPDNLRRPWKRLLRTIALNNTQSPAPTPDALELRSGMRVYCHDGYIGRIEGIIIDTQSGIADALLVRVRSNPMANVKLLTNPMASLLPVAGQRILVPPAWAAATKLESGNLPFRGSALALHLEASAEQVGSCGVLRSDEDVVAAIWAILSASPALAPYTGGLRVSVVDGAVTLQGTLPSSRHRASAAQDVWHVPGVFALNDEVTVRE